MIQDTTKPNAGNAVQSSHQWSESDLLDLLSEAAIEISNLDGPGNVVVRRIRSAIRAIEADAK